MSINFGSMLRDIAAFFESSAHPEIQAAAPSVVQPLKQAAAALESAAPSIATSMANAALASIPEAALLSPLADELIDGAIANLEAHKSAPVAAAA